MYESRLIESAQAPRAAMPPHVLRGWVSAKPGEPWYIQDFILRPLVSGRRYIQVKRLIDLALVILLLLPALVLLALCAVAIRVESPGPVVFTQWRTGRHGRRFKVYKLRTMVANAEALKARYAHLNVLTPPDFKIINDPRLTRVGRFLRRTSLDELPQILNIIRGEMSFVGPRPTSFHAKTYQPWQRERLRATPGLTGLWQVVGRAEVDFDERCRLDIFYVRHCSLRLDLLILLHTAGAVFGGRGAA